MKVSYYLANPTGNMTILVETPVPAASQPFFARQLMAAEPTAEQVGFLSETAEGGETALRMAGGEFCGNATMSAAALYCEKNGLSSAEICVVASGAKEPVPVMIRKLGDGSYRGRIRMPTPSAAGQKELEIEGRTYQFPLLNVDGISHLIIRESMEKTFAEAAVRKWCRDLNADALGLMFLDLEKGRLTPLVYVPAADTLYWESSCASGSAAVGACLAVEKGFAVSKELLQPGGMLRVEATPEGTVFLHGTVRFEHRASIFCHENANNNNL